MKEGEARRPNPTGKILRSPILALFAMLALVFPLVWWSGETRAAKVDSDLREKLGRQVTAAAADIDISNARKIGFTKADLDSEASTRLEDQLNLLASSIPPSAILTIGLKDGHLLFGPRSRGGSEAATAAPGTEYRGSTSGIMEAFAERKLVVIQVAVDGGGKSLSAIAPVVDPSDDESLFVLSLDLPASRLGELEGAARWEAYRSWLFVLFLLLSGVIASLAVRSRARGKALRLRSWILTPVAAAMLVGIGVFIAFFFRTSETRSRADMVGIGERIQDIWRDAYSSQIQLLEAKMDNIESNPAIVEAFSRRDLRALGAAANAALGGMRDEYQITHLLFANPDGTIFLRTQFPEDRGEYITRPTMLMARRSGEDAWGIDMGSHGDLSIRFIRPVRAEGRVIGYLELGAEVERIVRKAFAGANFDVLLVIRKTETSRAAFEEGRLIYGLSGKWDAYPDFVVADQTIPIIPSELARHLELKHGAYGDQDTFTTSQGPRILACEVINLNNIEGRDVGHLAVMQDITASADERRSSLFMIAALGMVLILSVLILLWQVTKMAERRISSLLDESNEKTARYRVVADYTYAWETWTLPDGSLVYCSPSCAAITGYEAADFFRDPLLLPKLAHPEDSGLLARHFEEMPSDGDEEPRIIEARIVTKGGEERWISHICQRIHSRDGTYLGIRSSNRDITEERATRDRLLTLSTAIEQSPVSVVITDVTGNIEYVNPKFTDATGYTADEVVGRNPRILKSGEMPTATYRELWNTILSGSSWHGVFHNKRKNGLLYWESATISPVSDGEGRIRHFLAIKEDITERKKMEEQLRLQAKAMDSAPGYILVADATLPDLPIIYANTAFERLTGYSKSDILGRNARMLQGSERDQPGLETLRLGLKQGVDCVALVHNRKKDGTTFWNEIRVSPVKDGGGKITHFVGISNDVTDLVKARNELAESEKRLRLAVEGAGDGVWDWNLKTDEMLFSALYMKMLGFEPGELPHRVETWRDSVHPDDRQRVEARLMSYLSGQDPDYVVEIRLRCKDEGYKWILCRGAIVTRDGEGMPLRMIGIHSDITARKAVEDAAVQSREAAERANRAKSEFLSAMSHELRTPMNAILGFGQLLELDEKLDATQHDFIQEMTKAGRHLLDLINEVLDLSRIESGRIELSLEEVECAELVDECIGLVTPLATMRGIALERGFVSRGHVRADRVRLKQVLVNLLSNAVKYNRKAGEVRIETSVEEDRLRFTVSDTGLGIPVDRMGELFVPFNRLGAENGEIEGTGIGLSISKKLVELMGGSIGAESEEGKGSRFWIDMPLSEKKTIPAALQSEGVIRRESPGGPRRMILHIEDNPANLRLVKHILGRREDIDLMSAHSAALGLELAEARRPDLIILDLNMPEMDGYEVLARLRVQEWGKNTPVVAVTAHAMPHDRERGLAAGFSDYLTKPLDIPLFLATLDKHLENPARGSTEESRD